MAERDTSDAATLAFLTRHAGKGRLLALLLMMFVASATEGIGLVLLVPITSLVAGGQSMASDWPDWLRAFADWPLVSLLVAVVVLVSLRAILVFLTNEGRRTLGLELGRQMRAKAHDAVLGANWRWLSRQNSADHAALIVGEADRVSGLANQGLSILTATITLAILTLSAALISWKITFVIVSLAVVASLGVVALRRKGSVEGTAYFEAYRAMQRLVSNGLQHLRAARIAHAEDELGREFSQASGHLVDAEGRFFRTGHRNALILQIVAVIALAALVYAALELADLPLAIFLPILAISARVVPLAGTIHEGLRNWRFNTPALHALLDMIEEAEHHRDKRIDVSTTQPIRFAKAIELRAVDLSYEDRPGSVLRQFDLSISNGSVTTISGPSGSGKSTIADLVSGLLVPDSGEILIDGNALDDAGRLQWRRQVAYVEQTPFLMDASIARNLRWGVRDASEDDLWRVLDAASAEFVRDLPDGLETRVGEGGRQLSGGEKQRVALARAMLSDPDMLILDEVSAALDQANTNAIVASIERLRGTCTVLILSHDPALIAVADQVVELEHPRNATDKPE